MIVDIKILTKLQKKHLDLNFASCYLKKEAFDKQKMRKTSTYMENFSIGQIRLYIHSKPCSLNNSHMSITLQFPKISYQICIDKKLILP